MCPILLSWWSSVVNVFLSSSPNIKCDFASAGCMYEQYHYAAGIIISFHFIKGLLKTVIAANSLQAANVAVNIIITQVYQFILLPIYQPRLEWIDNWPGQSRFASLLQVSDRWCPVTSHRVVNPAQLNTCTIYFARFGLRPTHWSTLATAECWSSQSRSSTTKEGRKLQGIQSYCNRGHSSITLHLFHDDWDTFSF